VHYNRHKEHEKDHEDKLLDLHIGRDNGREQRTVLQGKFQLRELRRKGESTSPLISLCMMVQGWYDP